jgi:hypothetical protein
MGGVQGGGGETPAKRQQWRLPTRAHIDGVMGMKSTLLGACSRHQRRREGSHVWLVGPVHPTSDAPKVIRERRSHGGTEHFRGIVPAPPEFGRDDVRSQSRYSQMWAKKPTTGQMICRCYWMVKDALLDNKKNLGRSGI